MSLVRVDQVKNINNATVKLNKYSNKIEWIRAALFLAAGNGVLIEMRRDAGHNTMYATKR